MRAAVLAIPVVLGIVVVGGLLFVLVRAQPRYSRFVREAAADRIVIALVFSLLVAVGVGTAFQRTNGGTSFQLAGVERYITAPMIYGAFTIVLLTSTTLLDHRPPRWVVVLPVITALAILTSPFTGNSFTAASFNQGVVIFGGTALLGLVGSLRAAWTENQQQRLVVILCGAGTGIGVLQLANGVFSALVLPASVALLYLVALRVRHWPLLAVLGLAVIVPGLVQNAAAIDPSAATTGQLVVSAALFLFASLPVKARAVTAVIGVAVGLAAAFTSSTPGLMLGVGADLDDVTLAQRAFETQRVFEQAGAHPLAILLGGGPGATVNLVGAPDAATLEGSGRDLFTVPSLHLLTTYVVLKLGLLGIAWLAVFVGSTIVVGWRVLSQTRPPLTQLVLLVFVVAGIVQALPAATFLFSNPLPALLLGLLANLQRNARQVDARPRARRALGAARTRTRS